MTVDHQCELRVAVKDLVVVENRSALGTELDVDVVLAIELVSRMVELTDIDHAGGRINKRSSRCGRYRRSIGLVGNIELNYVATSVAEAHGELAMNGE